MKLNFLLQVHGGKWPCISRLSVWHYCMEILLQLIAKDVMSVCCVTVLEVYFISSRLFPGELDEKIDFEGVFPLMALSFDKICRELRISCFGSWLNGGGCDLVFYARFCCLLPVPDLGNYFPV
ncbi:hypothetical protein Pfo_000206 [Paulownia fortunei]|nr:hypothetical protein Pfo_000206 [Paulownia fortunei]